MPAPAAPGTPRRSGLRRALRASGRLLLALALLAVLAVGGLLAWATTDGSLATALKLAGKQLPLSAHGAHGAVLGGGTIDSLLWESGGLRVEIDRATLDWRPRELLARRLHVLRLSAERIVIENTGARREESSPLKLPESLALPLGFRVNLDSITVDEIRWQPLSAGAVRGLRARLDSDGQTHALELQDLHYHGDRYEAALRGRIRAGAAPPIQLDAQISAAASTSLPGSEQNALAALQAAIIGPLSEMRTELRLQVAPASGGDTVAPVLPPLPVAVASLRAESDLAWPVAGNAQPARINARGRITPEATMPLQEASAELRSLDLHAFLPRAPRTGLDGHMEAMPAAPTHPDAPAGWTLRATLDNTAAGPWDAQQLPVDRLDAKATWQDGVATLENLRVELGGGRVETSGKWRDTGGDDWEVTSRIEHLNPALLHGGLAAFPIGGTARAAGQGSAIDFDVALAVTDTTSPPETAARRGARSAAGQQADALVQQLHTLAVRQVRASGRLADGFLTVEHADIQADHAALEGTVRVRIAEPEQITADGNITLHTPGLMLTAQAEQLAAHGGNATVRVDLADAAAALEWARKFPGAGGVLDGAAAVGQARLDAKWAGGWLDPEVQAKLLVPQLDITLPGALGTTQIRALDASANGQMAKAALALQGRILQPVRTVDLQVALDAQGGWSAYTLTLERLRLHAGAASVAGRTTVTLASTEPIHASADLQVKAPGLAGTIQGTLAPTRGGGTLRVDLSDAAATLGWIRTLPGAAQALAGVTAAGSARLAASWQGGLDSARIDASMSIPRLDYTPGEGAALGVHAVNARLTGDVTQASLTAEGQLAQGKRMLDFALAADGGRTPGRATAWRGRLARLAAHLQAPELGAGTWQIATGNQIPIGWTTADGGQLEVAAGQITLRSPAPAHESVVAWGPARWQRGALSSTGRISELPLSWITRAAGAQLEEAGVSGDVVLGGEWDIRTGSKPVLTARIARIRGDLNVEAGAADDGAPHAVAAGLREALAEVRSNGDAINLSLKWNSERAGKIDGVLATRLVQQHGREGQTRWSWPEQAPLQGRLRAELPEISLWSLLAPPGWRLHGSLHADATIAGTAGQPQIMGTLSADNLALRAVADGLQFEQGRLRARLQDTRFMIDEFVLHGPGADGGSIRLSGEADLLDGKPSARARMVIDKLHASVRDDRDLVASGQIDAGLAGKTVSAKGTLTVDRARIILPDESRPTLGDDVVIHQPGARNDAPEPLAAQEAAKARTHARESALQSDVEIQIELGRDFQVQGLGIDTRLAGDLALTANGPLAGMPEIKGRIETIGGTIRAYGQHLEIERGRIFFTGEASNPGLDILAVRPNYTGDQKVGALVQGTALLPQVSLYSEPTLPDDQVLAWLILGHAAPESGGEAAMMQAAALALLSGRNGGSLASSFGLDELSVSGATGSGLSDASVTLGKRLSDRLYTAYEHSLSGTGGVLMIFYELSRRWAVRGQASQTSGIDLIYRISYD